MDRLLFAETFVEMTLAAFAGWQGDTQLSTAKMAVAPSVRTAKMAVAHLRWLAVPRAAV